VVPDQELAIWLGTATEEQPRPGVGVELEEGKYLARQFGYFCAEDTELSVLSPVWVAPNGMSAHYITMPQPAPTILLTGDSLADLLRLAGVTHGLDKSALAQLLQDPGLIATHVRVRSPPAASRWPVAGGHGRVYLAFEEQVVEGVSPVLARYEATMVFNNDVLAEVTPPTAPQAVDGYGRPAGSQ
jgi:uncharacterized protein (DUF342 family)